MKKLLLTISVFATTIAQAQTSVTNSPLSATNTMCAFAYSSSVGYTPAGNVTASDNVYATAVHCDCCDQNTQCLTVSDFGFTIPAGAVIDGIVLEVEKRRNAGGSSGIVEDNGLQIMKGGMLTGPNKSQYGVDWPLTDAYVSYGSSTDLWGTTWTAADINASNFGVSLASISYVCGATITTRIDHVRMTIYYSTATGISSKAEGNGKIISFPNPVVSGNSITFSNITKIEQITITDILGKEQFKGSSDANSIVLPKMSSGVYFYSIVNDGKYYTGKITAE
jgi:hypothetical protein